MHDTREVVEAGGLISMDQLPRPVRARGPPCGQDSAGGEAWGHSCRAADQIRLGRQSDDRQSAWLDDSGIVPSARQRGDRLGADVRMWRIVLKKSAKERSRGGWRTGAT